VTGIEQTVVWLFGILCGSLAATSVARSWASARIEPARLHAEAYTEQCRLVAKAQGLAEPLTVPPDWSGDL